MAIPNFGRFPEFETLNPHNFGLVWSRKMLHTILEPSNDTLSIGIWHRQKFFALWAKWGKMRF